MADVLPLRILPTDPPDPSADLADVPLVVDARRLAKLLCVGLRTIRAWDAAGKLPVHVRISGRVLWRVDEIRAWLGAGAPDRSTWEARKGASGH